MVALVVLLALAQAPASRGPFGVAVVSKRAGVEAIAPAIAARVQTALGTAGLQGVLTASELSRAFKGKGDPRSCNAAPACLARFAAFAGPRAVLVGVDVGKVAKTLAIHLEAISAEGGASLAVADVTSTVDSYASDLDATLAAFVRELDAASKPPPALRLPDAPVAVRLEPLLAPDASPALVEGAVVTRPARVLPWVLVGTAAVATGVAAGFGVSGIADRNAYGASITTTSDGVRVSSQTDAQLEALANSTNAKATIALTSGLVAVALAAVGGVLFATGD